MWTAPHPHPGRGAGHLVPSGCGSGEILKHLDELTLKLSVEDVPPQAAWCVPDPQLPTKLWLFLPTPQPSMTASPRAGGPRYGAGLRAPQPFAPDSPLPHASPRALGPPHGPRPDQQPGDPAREGGGSCRLLMLLGLLSQCVGLALETRPGGP